MISEQDFLADAIDFLRERLGSRANGIDGNTELIESGLLDSLLVLEFFFFLEGVRGSAIEPDDDGVRGISTLREAYRLVVSAP